LEGQGEVVRIYAAAIICHLDEALSAISDLDQHLMGTGINGVFHQLLYHRSRPLDHLTGSDLIYRLLIQGPDPLHLLSFLSLPLHPLILGEAVQSLPGGHHVQVQ